MTVLQVLPETTPPPHPAIQARALCQDCSTPKLQFVCHGIDATDGLLEWEVTVFHDRACPAMKQGHF